MELSGLDSLPSKSDAQVDEVRNGRCQRRRWRRRLGVEQCPRSPAIAGYGLPFVVDIPVARHREDFQAAVAISGETWRRGYEPATFGTLIYPVRPAVAGRRLPGVIHVVVAAPQEQLQPPVRASEPRPDGPRSARRASRSHRRSSSLTRSRPRSPTGGRAGCPGRARTVRAARQRFWQARACRLERRRDCRTRSSRSTHWTVLFRRTFHMEPCASIAKTSIRPSPLQAAVTGP